MDTRRYRTLLGLIALLGGLTVWVVASEIFPYHSINHDEGVYLQQATMLLERNITLTPDLPTLTRPWFFVVDGSQLFPKYAPVPAAMFAIGVGVGVPRLSLVLIGIAVLVLIGAIGSELFDHRTGVLAAVLCGCSPLFIFSTSVFLPYAPTSLLNLIFAYSYLRANSTRNNYWAIIGGLAIGLAFFSRPYTAVLFAVPFVIHAVWILFRDRSSLSWLGLIAGGGLAGVATALAYNSVLTGDPLVFPFEAFAPEDGLGFGQQKLLNHELEYTPSLAVTANATVLESFGTSWFVGGLVGIFFAGVGMVETVIERNDRRLLLMGVCGSVVCGNVFFWGNYNLIGSLAQRGDGLIAYLGPYYHFDLLLSLSVFGAWGLWIVVDRWRTVTDRIDRQSVTILGSIGLLVLALCAGSITAVTVSTTVDRNAKVTDSYERAYEPFEERSLDNALVLLPRTYGDWLNHPFQYLRNTPNFDGAVVYTTDGAPLQSVSSFPNRTVYRYRYRGPWNPAGGSPTESGLQRVDRIRGETISLETDLKISDEADDVTVRVGTDTNRTIAVSDSGLPRTLSVSITADGAMVQNATDRRRLPIGNSTVLTITASVDRSENGTHTTQLTLPISVSGSTVRTITPWIDFCTGVSDCDGSSTYLPPRSAEFVSLNGTITGTATGSNRFGRPRLAKNETRES
ncbi:ArnT family glycosyltransferase [Halocatena halophila]|uniref:ArnT family glycosyltransferase n=1 Tax=Halocatena halophila TaxID=2814576 RepID=UPI002ED2103A